MIVLGFDTSTPVTAVGLRAPGGRTLQARDDPAADERPGHATRLLPLAADLLEQAGLAWSAIERIAVGVGPGGFTGLRVGVASARGLAQSLGAELVGVSSLRALAHGAMQQETTGPILAVIDARRGEVFAAAYRGDEELFGPRASALQNLDRLVDEAGGGRLAVGDGAVRCRDLLEAQGARVPADDSPLHKIDGAAVCEIAASLQPAAAVTDILPDYLRRPDAEIALERRHAGAETGAETGAPA